MFGDWSAIDEGRIIRATELKLINVNEDCTYAECKGSGKDSYKIHQNSCSCPDHAKKGYICKHMIALAGLRGDLDLPAMVKEIERQHKIEELKTKLSIAYAQYYLFKSPSMSDSEYDSLKGQFSELTGITL